MEYVPTQVDNPQLTTPSAPTHRLIIRNAVNASEKDCVVFAGSGCTGAVHKLIHCLGLASLPQAPVSWKSLRNTIYCGEMKQNFDNPLAVIYLSIEVEVVRDLDSVSDILKHSYHSPPPPPPPPSSARLCL